MVFFAVVLHASIVVWSLAIYCIHLLVMLEKVLILSFDISCVLVLSIWSLLDLLGLLYLWSLHLYLLRCGSLHSHGSFLLGLLGLSSFHLLDILLPRSFLMSPHLGLMLLSILLP